MARRVVVLGAGATGQAFCAALRRLDDESEIALVEQSLVGGECTYWACMPSKTLLRPTEAAASAGRAPGAKEALRAPLDAGAAFAWRDAVVGNYDDAWMDPWLAELRIELVRASGRVAGPGVVEAGGRELPYDALVVATGSRAAIPPIAGLEGLPYWTSRDATSAAEVPRSLAVLGGGAVGCELAQGFRRLGSEVTLVQSGARLLPREDAEAGELLRTHLEEDGVVVRVCSRTEEIACGHEGGRFRLRLPDGDPVEGDRLLVATGRRPNVEGLGLEELGVEIGPGGIAVDETLQAAPGVWAIGDVTGIANFTHVGKYHGRVAAQNVAGRRTPADHDAIPAVIFTDPQVASVGRTEGEGLVTGRRRLEQTSRTSTYERPKRPGFVKVAADPERRVLVGAVAVGPEAGEWLGQLTLAVRARVPVDVLLDTIQPYPTFSEAVFFAVRDLDLPARRAVA